MSLELTMFKTAASILTKTAGPGNVGGMLTKLTTNVSKNPRAAMAVAGGVVGAGTGAAASDNSAQGALVGGAIGAAAGYGASHIPMGNKDVANTLSVVTKRNNPKGKAALRTMMQDAGGNGPAVGKKRTKGNMVDKARDFIQTNVYEK